MSNPTIDAAKTGPALTVRALLAMTTPTACDMVISVSLAALMNVLNQVDSLEQRVAALDGKAAP